MNRPNIFDYAKKELSQDAIIAWFFACLHSNEKEYKQIGIKFINYILDSNYSENEICIEKKSPEIQCHKMDIYSVVKIGDFVHPIIVEDKTDTFLHSNQFEKYCKQVAEWTTEKKYLNELRTEFANENLNWGDLFYVYFKSGFVPEFEKREFLFEKDKAIESVKNTNSKIRLNVKEIYLNDMIGFLENLKSNDYLLSEYLEFLKSRKEIFDNSFKNALNVGSQEDYNNWYSNVGGCSKLFKTAFGKYKKFNNHLYQGWASTDIFVIDSKINNDSKNDIWYCFRFEKCSYKGEYYAYAFQFQQYRYEKGTIGGDIEDFLNEKNVQARVIQDLCKQIVKEMDCPVEIINIDLDSSKGIDGKMLFKIFICEHNTPENVCSFINKFTTTICERVNAKKIFFPNEYEKNL